MRAPHRDDVKTMLLDITDCQKKVLRAIGEKEMKCQVCSREQFAAIEARTSNMACIYLPASPACLAGDSTCTIFSEPSGYSSRQ
mmetsp:Transcript_26047/g.40411  ORF Transcript_26047/g.40411 Transcript_26047/m.40411 type:complete len:84 (+) Transcript_26047:47-298(+)